VGLLQGIPPPALDALAAQCRWKRVTAGQTVIARDADDNDLYMVVSGRVQAIAYSADGRQVNYREIPAGEFFGELAALDGGSRTADVVAMDDSLVAAMSPGLLRRLLREHVAVSDRMLTRLAGSVRELTERVFEFSTLGVRNRLHAELLRLARRAGVADNVARLDPAPGHAEIASNISTYREQVTRELSAMERQGLIKRLRKTHVLVILDVGRLERIVAEVRRAG
jgi:CRP-like cAMP-binding protein